MSWRNVGVIFRKEFRDLVRDRRTLISSIVVPILIVPILFIVIGLIGYLISSRALTERATIMILGTENAPTLAARLRSDPNFEIVPADPDYAQRIDQKKLRLALEFPPGMEEKIASQPQETQTIRAYWYEDELRSLGTLRKAEKDVNEYRDEIAQKRLAAHNLTGADAKPFEVVRQDVAGAEKVTGNILGYILPYMVIIFCLTGAMPPAIDLTAGEKERGTMETIIASPAGRVEIVLGKFLVVALAGIVAAALVLTSFSVFVIAGAGLIGRINKNFVLSISGPAMVTVFVMILPLAVLFAAILMAIALKAKSYREAQTHIAPLLFVAILPAVASTIPGLELTPKLALVPILNMSLAAKEIFAGQHPWKMVGLIFASTCVYAGLALRVAVRQFHREDIIFRT
jgi:sodium transport system permease protein